MLIHFNEKWYLLCQQIFINTLQNLLANSAASEISTSARVMSSVHQLLDLHPDLRRNWTWTQRYIVKIMGVFYDSKRLPVWLSRLSCF